MHIKYEKIINKISIFYLLLPILISTYNSNLYVFSLLLLVTIGYILSEVYIYRTCINYTDNNTERWIEKNNNHIFILIEMGILSIFIATIAVYYWKKYYSLININNRKWIDEAFLNSNYILLPYTAIGIFIVLSYLFIMNKGRHEFVWLFFAWGGLDLIGKYWNNGSWNNLFFVEYIEDWSNGFQFWGMGTYLSIFPILSIMEWIAILYIIVNTNKNSMFEISFLFVLLLLSIYSWISYLCLIPYLIVVFCKNIANAPSVQFFVFLLIHIFVFLYMMKSLDFQKYGNVTKMTLNNGGFVVICIFIALEILPWAIINYEYCEKNILFWISICELLLLVFLSLKYGLEFCVVSALTPLSVIAIQSINSFQKAINANKTNKIILFILIFMIGLWGNINTYTSKLCEDQIEYISVEE